jgi:hypothetical protein
MDQGILRRIQTELTVDVWPDSGKALGFKTKGASYAAARRGDIKTVEGQGRRRKVPTAWLRRVLCLDEGPPARRPRKRKHRAREVPAATPAPAA